MKAAVLKQFNSALEIEEFSIPQLAATGSVLVKILAAAVCGLDPEIIDGKEPEAKLPLILGHQGIGQVEEIQGRHLNYRNKSPLKKGDVIAWNQGVSCGKCYFCDKLHKTNLCPDRWVYGISKSCEEEPYLNGCFSEYIVLDPKTEILSFDYPDLSPSMSAPLTGAGATIARAVHYSSPINPKNTILIQGFGSLAMYGVLFASKLNPKQIIVIGERDDHLQFAKKFGATLIFNSADTSLKERRDAIMDITKGIGVDFAMEVSGNSAAFKEGLDLVRRGGEYHLVGFGHPTDKTEVDYFDITNKAITIRGIWVSDMEDLLFAVDSALTDRAKFSTIVTETFSLENINDAINKMRNNEVVQPVVIP